jgi:DnaJ homolog subfamily C member 19
MNRRAMSATLNTKVLSKLSRGGGSLRYQNKSSDMKAVFTLSLDSRRQYSVTPKRDSALIIGGLGVVVCAATAQYALQMMNKSKESNAAGTASDAPNDSKDQSTSADKTTSANGDAAGATKEDSPFAFTSTWFAKTFYDGGFEEKMTRREAALILGIRESASVDRVKEAYRKLLPLNHPDKGGSAYIATKINEAKDLLLKGK